MKKSPVLIGVTGGLGSGKSTVCRFLADRGCRLFEADRVARSLQVNDPGVVEAMVQLFGEGVYSRDRDGRLVADRAMIARRVFSDAGLLRRLNGIIHPRVRTAFDEAVREAGRDGVGMLVKEAAILFESGADRGLDEIIVVVADMQIRVQRALDRGMTSRDEVLRRIRAQWPQEELEQRADYVIDNNGSLEELRARTDSVYDMIRAKYHVPG
ncbi:dephospho-CoA kinase [Prosthecochloris sp. N3]|uniref:Dephospho-CoA kinase n=1 Tax=Prosthecochloris ethylica TaxID=2743976 RepID=A0ABR9XTS6_9CHLB|nr:dephospho-CoA kinase [Prosthecochloris ethylica]MBF0637467.1 dephospho-CoA kinase [Prosthecochloris ethylica]NUK48527.1 dephospho-CoA kinase [Prosthecochloris ethylica]